MRMLTTTLAALSVLGTAAIASAPASARTYVSVGFGAPLYRPAYYPGYYGYGPAYYPGYYPVYGGPAFLGRGWYGGRPYWRHGYYGYRGGWHHGWRR